MWISWQHDVTDILLAFIVPAIMLTIHAYLISDRARKDCATAKYYWRWLCIAVTGRDPQKEKE